MVPDRTHKAQAPEPLVPTNRFGSPEGAIKHFVESRATTEDFLKTTTGLRDHVTTARWASWMDMSLFCSSRRTASGTPSRSMK